MQKERVMKFLKNKGTLGVLTLCLVGATAFATYQISYEEKQQIEQESELQRETQEQKAAQEISQDNVEVNGDQVEAKLVKAGDYTDANELDVDLATLINEASETEESAEGEESVDAGSVNVQAQILPTVNFREDSALVWPTAGTVLMDYNMSGTVYFETLDQYKYNPALIIGSEAGNPVIASAKGIVESVDTDEETGLTMTLNLGNDYSLIYGQLKELAVSEGDVVEQGQLLGYVSEPTKYYCEEGSNLYFQMKKDGQTVDPCLYLE